MIWSFAAVAILLLAKYFAEPSIRAIAPPPYGDLAVQAVGIALIVAVAVLIDRIVRRFYWHGHLKKRLGRDTPELIQDIVTWALVLIALSVGLSTEAGFSMAALATASGATAVVLGIALQAVIQDLFSGLAINLEGSYAIGDYLTVFSDQGPEPVYGRVIGISWRSTLLRQEDGCLVMIPNHLATTNPVTNHSRPREGKRLSVDVPVDNRFPPARVMDLLLGEAFKVAKGPGFERLKEPSVVVKNLTADGVIFEVRFYSFPDQLEPGSARSIMLRALLDVIQQYTVPTPLTQIEMVQAFNVDAVPGDMETRRAISRARLFKDVLNPEQIDRLTKLSRPADKPAGTVLMNQGDAASSMVIILEGAASITVKGTDGISREVAVSATGDVAGEMSLMTGSPRTATVVALTTMRVLEITKEAMEDLLRASPELLGRFSHILAKRQLELDQLAHRVTQREKVESDLLTRMTAFFSRAFGVTART
ncbi:MAG: mechanosensitive ion channel family protein [Proteobacteria bacterium]|nr:mechanosensitive ion channel family protein [Pseudomonadota bacterium]